MGMRRRQEEGEHQISQRVTGEAIRQVKGRETIEAVLADGEATGTRQRKLPWLLTLLLCLAMNLWSEVSLTSVWVRLGHGTRLLRGKD